MPLSIQKLVEIKMSLPWTDFFKESTSTSNNFWMRSSITVFTGLQLIFKQSTLTALKNANGHILTRKRKIREKDLHYNIIILCNTFSNVTQKCEYDI